MRKEAPVAQKSGGPRPEVDGQRNTRRSRGDERRRAEVGGARAARRKPGVRGRPLGAPARPRRGSKPTSQRLTARLCYEVARASGRASGGQAGGEEGERRREAWPSRELGGKI